MAKLTLIDLASTNAASLVATTNANNALIEAALEKTLSRDGTSPNTMEDLLDMNSERIINLPEPISSTEPVRKGEFDAAMDTLDASVAAAINAQTAAENALDEFTDVWLGEKPTDPIVDNDGNPLQGGALYYDTANLVLKIYRNGSWGTVVEGVVVASAEITPSYSLGNVSLDLNAGSIDETKLDASTNASLDLADGSLQRSGGTMTGKINTVASSATEAGVKIPTGTAPTTPVDGDLWTTSANILIRLNGTTRTLVSEDATQTLTNKTLNLANNTVTGTLAEFNAAISDADIQPLDATLTALAAFNTNGLLTQTGPDAFTARTLTAPAAGITISNGDGVSGNPTFALANDLSALEGLSSTGFAVRSTTDTWVQRSLATPAAGFTITNSDGVSGNPTFVLANDLGALEALSSTGIAVRSGVDTWVQRSLTAPAEGMSITNNDGVSGNPTFVFSNDLGALEALSSTGIAVRTGSDTWAQRTVTGTTGKITVSNGDGVSGNPTVTVGSDIVDETTANTYTAGAKQTFQHDATTAGLNIAPAVGDPSTPADGDIWYNSTSGVFRKRQGGVTTNLDTTGGGGGGSVTIETVEVDFTTPAREKFFDAAFVGAVAGQKVVAMPSISMPTGVSEDELEFEPLVVSGHVLVDNFVRLLVASSRGGLLFGKRNINFILV